MERTTGLVKNGVILPDIPVDAREGERVLITFLAAHDDAEASALSPTVQLPATSSTSLVEYIPPAESLAVLLANVMREQPLDAAAWNAEWTKIEAEMKERDFTDDEHESPR